MFGWNVKVELDLSNYVTKSDLKNAACVDILKFAEKTDLGSLKSEIDKLDIDELETTPVNLSKLSNAIEINIVKSVYMMNQFKMLLPFRVLILVM